MPDKISNQKDNFRQQYISKRKKIPLAEVKSLSVIISNKFLTINKLLLFKNYLIYLPIDNEVDTKYLIRYLIKENKNVFVPAYIDDKWIIAEIKGLNNLSKNKFGTLQPDKFLRINIHDIDVTILPGLAFDQAGNRLGYGKGVYDKLLKDFKGYKIGLGFDFQLIKKLPRQSFDIKVDMFVSEKRIVNFIPI